MVCHKKLLLKYAIVLPFCLLIISSLGCEQSEKKIKKVTVSFLGIQNKGMTDSSKNIVPHPVEKMWSTTISDSLFIESVKNIAKWKDAPDYYCARNVMLEIEYFDSKTDTIKASIYDDCPFAEFISKQGFHSKYFDEYSLSFLRNLIKEVPEIEGWDKL